MRREVRIGLAALSIVFVAAASYIAYLHLTAIECYEILYWWVCKDILIQP